MILYIILFQTCLGHYLVIITILDIALLYNYPGYYRIIILDITLSSKLSGTLLFFHSLQEYWILSYYHNYLGHYLLIITITFISHNPEVHPDIPVIVSDAIFVIFALGTSVGHTCGDKGLGTHHVITAVWLLLNTSIS